MTPLKANDNRKLLKLGSKKLFNSINIIFKFENHFLSSSNIPRMLSHINFHKKIVVRKGISDSQLELGLLQIDSKRE